MALGLRRIGPHSDLSGVDLRGLDLRGADLSFSNLTEANLEGVNLREADLTAADLTNTKLKGAYFDSDTGGAGILCARRNGLEGPHFIPTDFREVVECPEEEPGCNDDVCPVAIPYVGLRGVTLRNADFTGALLFNADLSGAVFDGSRFDEADLEDANFSRASLVNTDMSSVLSLSGVNFRGANMSGASLSGFLLLSSPTTFVRTNLRGATLTAVSIACLTQDGPCDPWTGAVYDESTRQPATGMAGAVSLGAACSPAGTGDDEDDCQGRPTIDGDLAGMNLAFASLRGRTVTGNMMGTNLYRADLRGTDLSGATIVDANFAGAVYDTDTLFPAEVPEGTVLIDTSDGVARIDAPGANLSGLDLSLYAAIEGDLTGTNLSRANLRGVDLSGAIIDGALMADADLRRATLDPLTVIVDHRTLLPAETDPDLVTFLHFLTTGSEIEVPPTRLRDPNLQGITLKAATVRFSAARGSLMYAHFTSSDLSQSLLNRASLVRAIACQTDLSRIAAVKADLSGIDMWGDDDWRCDSLGGVSSLEGADLQGADLHRARLADLTGGPRLSLHNALLRNSHGREVDFWMSDLRGADLAGATLISANLSGVLMDDSTVLAGTNLAKSKIDAMVADGANLTGTDLTASYISDTPPSFVGTNLTRARLRDATLSTEESGPDFTGANLTGADLRGVDLCLATFDGTTIAPAPEDNPRVGPAYFDSRQVECSPEAMEVAVDLGDEEDLTGANLQGARIEYVDWSEMLVVGADLRNADLKHANLRGTEFGGREHCPGWGECVDLPPSDLTNTVLRYSYWDLETHWPPEFNPCTVRHLYFLGTSSGVFERCQDEEERESLRAWHRHANLVGANLSKSVLRHRDLSRADLRGANLEGADLRGTNFEYASFGTLCTPPSDLRCEETEEGTADCLSLCGALYNDETIWPEGFDPASAVLARIGPDADLSRADLSGLSLYGASLENANLTDVHAPGVDFRAADLGGANLSGAYLEGADFRSAKLSLANLSRANLRGSTMARANLYQADFDGARFNKNTSLRRANIGGADFSEVHDLGTADFGRAYGDAYTRWPRGMAPRFPRPKSPYLLEEDSSHPGAQLQIAQLVFLEADGLVVQFGDMDRLYAWQSQLAACDFRNSRIRGANLWSPTSAAVISATPTFGGQTSTAVTCPGSSSGALTCGVQSFGARIPSTALTSQERSAPTDRLRDPRDVGRNCA